MEIHREEKKRKGHRENLCIANALMHVAENGKLH